MSTSQHRGKDMPPLSVIHAAQAGDAEAMDCILRYYEGYINKLCTRKFHDEYGHSYEGLDEYMKHITIYYNCIGAFAVPGRRNIPNVEIKMGTRKGVAVSYSPERTA